MNGYQHPNRLKYAVILALGLGVAQVTGAVGLGPIIGVNSHLGQPLSASIRVDNISREQAQRASVSLASAEEYRSRGIQRLPSHDQLRFSLVPAGSGYRIQVSSSGGIREPFINFLLTINSDGERITREYALFLNPDPSGATPIEPVAALPEPTVAAVPLSVAALPEQTAPALPLPVASAQAQVAQTAPVSTAMPIALGYAGSSAATDNGPIGEARPASGVGIAPASAQTQGWGGQNVASATSSAPAMSGGGRYTVKSGDTLYRIARSVTPGNGDINATMRAIQRANPHAFSSSNMNSLMAGVTLTIPDASGAMPLVAEAQPAQPQPAPRRNNRRNQQQQQPAAAPPTPAEAVAAVSDMANTDATPVVEGASEAAGATEEGATALLAEVGQAGTAMLEVASEAVSGVLAAAQDTTPAQTGMDTSLTLQGMDSFTETNTADNPPAMEPPAGAEAPADVAPETATETVAQTEPVAAEPSAPPTVEAPPVVETAAPVVAQAPVQEPSSGLPFGLQIWHLAVAAGVALLGLLLAVLMKARGRKRSIEDIEDMSPADIDRMVAELENDSSLQHSFANNLDDLSYENLSQEKAQQDKNETDLLKARMAELAALEALAEEEDDDFDHLAKQAENLPKLTPSLHKKLEKDFDSFEFGAEEEKKEEFDSFAFGVEEEKVTTSKKAEESSFFSDWEFSDEEPTVQTSAHEAGVDDFFNVEEQLPEAHEPESVFDALETISQNKGSAVPEFSLHDTAAQKAAPAPAVVPAVSEENVEAMEINLDLATSFIATGNAARARVWLDEVMVEGSAAQKALAAQLLKKIDAQK